MRKKGSMTVAMSLMLLVLLSLLTVSIQASGTACGRVQAVNGIDVGLYSLFSEYDKDLLEDYNLFFLDAGYGTGKVNAGRLINHTEYYMKPVLESGLTRCKVQACAIDGLRMASDRNGKAVEQQMIRYMKNNLGNAGIEALKEMLACNQEIMKNQEQIQSAGIQETEPVDVSPMEGISQENNPLEIIKSIRKSGFLGLVLPADTAVSERELDYRELLSKRKLQSGFGEFQELDTKSSAADKLLIQEYILEKLGTFTQKKREGSLAYQTEYVLGGKDSDQANLSYVVNHLILIRETSNLAYLYTNGQKRAELEACASALSLLLLIPEGMALVQAVLAAGWAYVESLSDVRILLSGGKVPLAKDDVSWKTQLNHLNLEASSSETRGMDYQDYLRILLSFSSKENLVLRTMDMIEQNMRQIAGKENFALDVCLDAVSMSFQIQGPQGKIWQADRFYTYDM